MIQLIKIGVLITFFIFIFFSVFNIFTIIIKTKKRKKQKKQKTKDLLKITDEEYAQFDQENVIKSDPEIEKLSEKAKKKFFTFKKVFPIITYKKYKLLKFSITSLLFLFFTFSINFIFGLAGLALGIILPDFIAAIIVKKKINRFEIQLADGLTLISNALKSGTSFIQAVEVMIKEMKPPLSVEFSLFLKETRMGASIDEALNNLSKRIDSEELKITVVSINIARQSGGNLSEMLMHVSDTIRERERLKGKIDALTSQGKLSGFIIGVMPILLAFVLNKIDPIMMEPLFHSFIGQLILLAVFIMEVIAFIWIKKIVTIDM